jgi:hypothetical protein
VTKPEEKESVRGAAFWFFATAAINVAIGMVWALSRQRLPTSRPQLITSRNEPG